MKNYGKLQPVMLALISVGYLMIPTTLKAVTPDSAEITKLFADTKTVAVQLKTDSSQMDSFTRSKLSWQSYADKIETIKGHINNAGQLVARLKDAESTGSPWQQTTIKRIEPLHSGNGRQPHGHHQPSQRQPEQGPLSWSSQTT